MIAFALIFFLCLLGLVFSVFGLSIALVYHLAVGLVIGALGRLVLPGEEKISILGTALIGMAGSMIGHLVGGFLHFGEVVSLGIGVAAAALLLAVLGFSERR